MASNCRDAKHCVINIEGGDRPPITDKLDPWQSHHSIVITFLCCARKFGLVKDIRGIIAKRLYDMPLDLSVVLIRNTVGTGNIFRNLLLIRTDRLCTYLLVKQKNSGTSKRNVYKHDATGFGSNYWVRWYDEERRSELAICDFCMRPLYWKCRCKASGFTGLRF